MRDVMTECSMNAQDVTLARTMSVSLEKRKKREIEILSSRPVLRSIHGFLFEPSERKRRCPAKNGARWFWRRWRPLQAACAAQPFNPEPMATAEVVTKRGMLPAVAVG